MFVKFARSWSLVKASAGVLRQDKELLVFPAISVVASLLVMASFILPLFGLLDFKAMEQGEREPMWLYAWVFLFYLAQYFVIFYFNTALVGAAMIRLQGGDPTVADGLNIAWSKRGTIFGYALILFGLGWGGLYTMIQLLAVNAFGLSAAGKILGTITLLDATTAGLGIWIAARIFDVTGSYKPAFQLISVLIILALLAATLVRDERSSQA